VAKTFRCTIVTPADAVFDEDVSYVSFPAWDGQHGVMHGQSPLLSRLGIGAMRIERAGGAGNCRFHVDGGFAQVCGGALTILTEQASLPEDISAAEAEAELAEANVRATADGANRDDVENAQERARTRRAMAQTTS